MVDSGSQPTVADCEKEFPGHKIEPSPAQEHGVHYKVADGTLIPNLGQCKIVHREHDGELYEFIFQHAKVHTPIVSVLELVVKDCMVTFHKAGGHITYPTGKQIEFVIKEGVFFVALNVLPPGTTDIFGRQLGFTGHGR